MQNYVKLCNYMKKYSKVCKVSKNKINSKVCKSMQSCVELIKSMQKNVKQNKAIPNHTKVKTLRYRDINIDGNN